MSDPFLREIDEEVRRDRVADFWRRYQNVIIGGIVLLIASVGGWRFYQHQQERAAQAVSARLEGAMRAARENKPEEVEHTLGDIARAGNPAYALVARFRLAAEVARRDAGEGARAFQALADDAAIEPLFRDLARLRAGMLIIDTVAYPELRTRLEPLAAANGAWRHSARELLGLAALKANQMDEAGRWFDQLVTDRETPEGLRQRADLYLGLVRAGAVGG
jgi:hypothetical protein